MIARDFVTVVSGMPRSGTSLMMRMLEAGGIPPLTDGVRAPDVHNPYGYFEYEPVKQLSKDSSWMPAARGRAVKIIYSLLRFLPQVIPYRVIFMQRDMAEVFDSQQDMLRARGDAAAGQARGRMIAALEAEIVEAKEWLARQPDIRVLAVPYAGIVQEPSRWATAVADFLSGGLAEQAMVAAVDPALYRHRHDRRVPGI